MSRCGPGRRLSRAWYGTIDRLSGWLHRGLLCLSLRAHWLVLVELAVLFGFVLSFLFSPPPANLPQASPESLVLALEQLNPALEALVIAQEGGVHGGVDGCGMCWWWIGRWSWARGRW
jgi:hypothetical protein